jgi:hypothetical protein
VERTAVPVTAGLTAAAAEAALVAAGLVLGTSTTSMTDDTAAGLVASSSPAAGTGVAAGSAVDIVVSLGDRHTSIPVYRTWGDGIADTLSVEPTTAFDWVHPDGTVQNGLTCTYIPTRGAGFETVFIRCKAGKTVADLTRIQNGASNRGIIYAEDFKYLSPVYLYYLGFVGDTKYLNDVVGSLTTGLYLDGRNDSNYWSGSINGWEAINATLAYLIRSVGLTGALKFQAVAPTSSVLFNDSTGFSYADIASTIINWDAANAASFARTGNFNKYKRSLIGAANPAAEAATRSLITKTCVFTFAAEDIPTTNPAFYTVLLRDTNFTIDGTGVVAAARGVLTITGESCGATGLVPTGVEVAMGTVDATTGSYSKVDAQLASASFAQNDIVRIKLIHPGSGLYTYRYVVAGA